MSRSYASRMGLRSLAHRVTVITVTALLVPSLAACTAGPGPSFPGAPTRSPSSTPEPRTPSTSTAPTAIPAEDEPTSVRWVEGGMPGVEAAIEAAVAREFFVFGWRGGYLGFTSAYDNANGRLQGPSVTSSADGLQWHASGQLDPGNDDLPLVVTRVVEGPAGLLATAEQSGCAIHKPAVRMWRSSDGTSWTPIDLKGVFGADSLSSVSAGSSGYIAVSAAGKGRTVWTSSDGASWSRSPIPSGASNPDSVVSFRGGFVLASTTGVASSGCEQTTGTVAAHDTGSVWSSRTGSAWTAAVLPEEVIGTDTILSVDRLNDQTVLAEEIAFSADAPNGTRRDWTSSDGVIWRQSEVLTRALGYPLTNGARTFIIGSTDQGQLVIRVLTHDLRTQILAADASAPTVRGVAEAALGPAGFVVADASGATSWLGVPIQ